MGVGLGGVFMLVVVVDFGVLGVTKEDVILSLASCLGFRVIVTLPQSVDIAC